MTRLDWNGSDLPQNMLNYLIPNNMLNYLIPNDADETRVSRRKMRLLMAAACRQYWDFMEPEYKQIIRNMEACADGLMSIGDLLESRIALKSKGLGLPEAFAAALNVDDYSKSYVKAIYWSSGVSVRHAGYAFASVVDALSYGKGPDYRLEVLARQAALIRDIVGDPFETFKHDRGWVTPEVMRMASLTYKSAADDGRLDQLDLNELHDAAIDAGCPTDIEVTRLETAVRSCPDCGDYGFWRSGQEFDHMKKCRKKSCGRVWTPDSDTLTVVRTVPNPLLSNLLSPVPHYKGMWGLDLILGKK